MHFPGLGQENELVVGQPNPATAHKRHPAPTRPMHHHVCAISGWAISGPMAGASYIGHFAVFVLRTYVAMRLG